MNRPPVLSGVNGEKMHLNSGLYKMNVMHGSNENNSSLS